MSAATEPELIVHARTQYLNPDYPTPHTDNPLARLAQTCEKIGKDTWSAKSVSGRSTTQLKRSVSEVQTRDKVSERKKWSATEEQDTVIGQPSRPAMPPKKRARVFSSSAASAPRTNASETPEVRETTQPASPVTPQSAFPAWLQLLACLGGTQAAATQLDPFGGTKHGSMTLIDRRPVSNLCDQLRCLWLGCGARFSREQELLLHLCTHTYCHPTYDAPLGNAGLALAAEGTLRTVAGSPGLRPAEDAANLVLKAATPFAGISVLPNTAWTLISPLGLCSGVTKY